MKREHPDPQNQTNPKKQSGSSKRKTTLNVSGKMWIDEESAAAAAAAGDMDELLAVLGYKVRSSDMEEVAQKLEQLEMALGKGEDRINHLSADTVHYNPSDLSGWVQNMLFRLSPPHSSSLNQSEPYDRDDLRAIPGVAAYPQTMNRSHGPSSSSPSSPSSSSHPMVVVDSQETGVCLVHALLACAEAVQQDNFNLADALVKRVGSLAASQPGAMRKVATYFAEALARRIYNLFPKEPSDSSFSDSLESHFYEACPYMKFAHFTANEAILQSLGTATRVHVIDFSLKQGMQWPQLMQALALRPSGPPAFRLTGIGPPQPETSDALQQVGWKLQQMANMLGISFEFRRCNTLADIEQDIRPSDGEVIAVNSIFDFHRVLSRPGVIEKVLSTVKRLNPKIMTIVEQEANHNGTVFLNRFTEALHYYSSLFDSLEGMRVEASEDVLKSELYLGQQICNVVACEGPGRIERHETLVQWTNRMERAGFESVPIGSDAYRQASMLALFEGGDGYRVEERNGALLLGWHTRPLIASSAWRPAS